MKNIVKEFKEFISRGNVVDMAVGVIIGAAFKAIIDSLVADIVNPVIGLLTGGIDFSDMTLPLGSAADSPAINYGAFISAVINFFLIGLVVFLFVKLLNKMRRKKPDEPAPVTVKTCPYCKTEINLEATRCPNCTSPLEEAAE